MNNNKLEEIISYAEFLGDLIRNKMTEMKSRVEQGVSSRYLTDESERLISILDKYIILLARLKKEFNLDFSAEMGWEREVIWELRSLDEEKRQKAIKSIRDMIRDMKKGEL